MITTTKTLRYTYRHNMSGRNVTTQSLDQHLQQSLRKLWSEFQQFKNRQPIGADVLTVQSLPTATTVLIEPGGTGWYTIPVGHSLLLNFAHVPSSNTLTLWNFLVSLWID